MTRADGAPWAVSHLQHSLTAAVRAAEMRPGLSFHGLHKALHAVLAESEATDALVPHADANMTRYYRSGANRRKLARAGMRRLTGNAS